MDSHDWKRKDEKDTNGLDSTEEQEIFELEYCEDDIAYYLVDEDDNEIGFALIDENGNEVEYYYAEDEDEQSGGCTQPKDVDIKCEATAHTAGEIAVGKTPAGKTTTGKTSAGKTAAASGETGIDEKISAGKTAHSSQNTTPLFTREGVADAMRDINEIYHTGKEIGADFKEAHDDIVSGFDFLKKKKK